MEAVYIKLSRIVTVLILLSALSVGVKAQDQIIFTELSPEDIIKPGDDNPGNDDTTVFNGDTNALNTIKYEQVSLKVYPNPCNNGNIMVSSSFNIPLSLFSLDGKEILRFLTNTKMTVTNIPKGVYIIKSNDEKYRIKSTRLILI